MDKQKIKQIIGNFMYDNKENYHYILNEYDNGYADGYHDALVDLMDALGIEHNEEIINQ